MKTWLWIGGIVIVVVLGIYLFAGNSSAPAPVATTNTQPSNSYAVSATGNPDDIVNTYLQQANDEQSAMNGEVTAASVNSDSSALDGLGQSYDETKL